MTRKRRESVEETMERLRLLSAECSDAGLEETDESQVEQAPAKSQARKEYCAECHMSFGLAEPRVALDSTRVAHEDCYVKILRRQQERLNHIMVFSRHIH